MKTILLVATIIAIASAAAGTVDYTQNGDNWTDALCTSGTKQSPIDIPAETTCNSEYTKTVTWKDESYTNVAKTTPTTASPKQTIQVDKETGSVEIKATADGTAKVFKAAQFHIHAPSEHTIGGKQYAAELHIVHKVDGADEYAVLGMLFDKDLPALDDASKYFFSADRLDSSNFNLEQATFNPKNAFADILANHNEFFFYEGSLTTPPCTEGINWLLLKDPLPITTEQLSAIDYYFKDNADFAGGKGNNRKVQAIGERVISNGGLDACPDNSSSIVSFGLLSLGVLLFALF